MSKSIFRLILAGACAGAANGLFGAGGGMVLIPLLSGVQQLKENEIFPASVSIILPVCLISLLLSPRQSFPAVSDLAGYITGSIAGGILCGLLGRKIPVKWLHRILGILIIWGGIRYLC